MATCWHCGYESPDLAVCPLCGTRASQPDTTTAPAPAVGRPPAWEDPGTPFPRNLVDTWRQSVLDPTTFFRGVPFERAAGRPILFYLVISVLSAFFWLWWTAVFATVQAPFLAVLTGLTDPTGAGGLGPTSAAGSLLNFFLAPFGAILYLIIWSLVLHLFVLVFGRRRRNLTATVRAICYASGPSLLGIIPILGWLVGWVWTIVLSVIGIREGHRMSTGAATATVLLAMLVPGLILIFFFVLLVAAAASIGM